MLQVVSGFGSGRKPLRRSLAPSGPSHERQFKKISLSLFVICLRVSPTPPPLSLSLALFLAERQREFSWPRRYTLWTVPLRRGSERSFRALQGSYSHDLHTGAFDSKGMVCLMNSHLTFSCCIDLLWEDAERTPPPPPPPCTET